MLTFIVVNYNGKEHVEECLESIMRQSYRKFKVVVIDNASSDSSLETLRDYADKYSRVEVVENKENVGFAKAANQAIEIVDSKFVALVNNDAVLDRKWAEEMIRAADDLINNSVLRSPSMKILIPTTHYYSICDSNMENNGKIKVKLRNICTTTN